MDKGKAKQIDFYKKQVEERSEKFPKGQKWYLLNKLFGLMPSEIAEMEGMKGSSAARQLIIRVSDQLKAGEIRLIETTPEESKAAKARLDAHRAKRRERYASKNALQRNRGLVILAEIACKSRNKICFSLLFDNWIAIGAEDNNLAEKGV